MPHLIIEFSSPLLNEQQTLSLLNAVHQATAETKLFDEKNIKTRAHPIDFFRIGSGDKTFIHGHLRIHSGRSTSQKSQLTQAVLNAITEQNTAADVITVEVVDMDTATYAKTTSS